MWTIIRGFSWKSALANNYRTILFAAAVASMVAANFSYQKRKEKGPAINSIYGGLM